MLKISLSFWLMLAIAWCIPQSSPAASISGKVLASDGSAVKAAEVYCFNLPRATPAAEPKRTKTDENGFFRFDEVGPPDYELIAFFPGAGAAYLQFDGKQTAQLRLSPATDLTVRFLDAESKPIKDLPVRIVIIQARDNTQRFNGVVLPKTSAAPFAAKTDADGSITFAGLPQDREVQLAVDDDRFCQLDYLDAIKLATQPATKASPLQLKPAAGISGKIIAPSGTSPAGLQVTAVSGDTGLSHQTLSDSAGAYQFKQLPPGPYSVTLNLDPKNGVGKSWTARAIVKVDIVAGPTKEGLDFTLIPGGILTGTVLAEDTGKPLRGIPIAISGPAAPAGAGQTQSVFTDNNGTFTAHVPGGEQGVYVALNGNAQIDGYRAPKGRSRTIVHVEDGKTASVEFRLPKAPPTVTLTGKVVGPDSEAVGGASISLIGSADAYPDVSLLESKADGTFQVENVDPKALLTIRAHLNNFATPAATRVSGNSHDPIVLKLEKDALGSLTGKVIDEQGKPIVGATIFLNETFGRFSTAQSVGVTDASGSYRIDSLYLDAELSVDVSANGYGRSDVIKLHLLPGQTIPLPDFKLRLRDTPVAGVLLDDEGNPSAGVEVAVYGNSTYDRLVTDKDGKFKTTVVAGDKVRIRVVLKDGRRINKTVKAGDEHVMIDPMSDAK